MQLERIDQRIPAGEVGTAHSRQGEFLPAAAAIGGNAVWGLSFLFTRMATQVAAVPVMLSARFLVAFAALNLLIALGWGKVSLRGRDWRWLAAFIGKGWLYYNLESYGILYTSATTAGVILAATPVVTIILGAVCLGERPTLRQSLFSLLPILGVGLITAAGDPMGEIRPVGILLLIGASLVYALSTVMNRKMAEEYSPFERTYLNVLGCVAGFVVQGLFTTRGDWSAWTVPLGRLDFFLPVLVLGLLSSIGCEMLVNWAAGHMTAGQLAPFQSMETLVSMCAGVLLLGEPFSGAMALGAALILVGVWQISRQPEGAESRPEGQPEPELVRDAEWRSI